ncbi:TetR/AcrR family transcriptional regulator [Thalassolituus sp.]|jgi:AcrR family transcriptional regulator|uniref:TetR/AcrR family transcriptional regulator n=1 Tax=Thalassolituus sp. TaxID=2030822 RepID=UPI002A7FE62B|nr:TetR/AcrR family transcriptional regulator [Thalassolituus sp.]|tara:strand:- start:1140 stop:1820 length:681 start_codon:yes stop_codon:yes gene_type:complete
MDTDHKANTYQRLIKGARELVAEGGFAAATLEASAERALVEFDLAQRYFADNASLSVEVFRYATQHEVTMVFHASKADGENDKAAERLERAVYTYTRRALRAPRMAYALIAEPVGPSVEVERLKYRLAYAEIFEDLIQGGIRTGEFAHQNPSVSAAALVGLLAESLIGPLFPVQGDNPDISASLDARKTMPADQQIELTGLLCAISLRAIGAIPKDLPAPISDNDN